MFDTQLPELPKGQRVCTFRWHIYSIQRQNKTKKKTTKKQARLARQNALPHVKDFVNSVQGRFIVLKCKKKKSYSSLRKKQQTKKKTMASLVQTEGSQVVSMLDAISLIASLCFKHLCVQNPQNFHPTLIINKSIALKQLISLKSLSNK